MKSCRNQGHLDGRVHVLVELELEVVGISVNFIAHALDRVRSKLSDSTGLAAFLIVQSERSTAAIADHAERSNELCLGLAKAVVDLPRGPAASTMAKGYLDLRDTSRAGLVADGVVICVDEVVHIDLVVAAWNRSPTAAAELASEYKSRFFLLAGLVINLDSEGSVFTTAHAVAAASLFLHSE